MQYSLPKYLSQLGTTLPPSASLHPEDKFSLLDSQMDNMINQNPAHTRISKTVGIFYVTVKLKDSELHLSYF